jgi:hypothetical protein
MIKMKKYSQILLVAASFIFSGLLGCKKYLDVNQNLNDPTLVPVSTLLTAAEVNIASNFAIGSTLGDGLGVYTHELMQYGSYNRYGMDGGSSDGPWNSLYGAVSNLNVIISQGTEEERTTYVGIAKILKAYTFSMMVDIWGDIPYTEYDNFKSGIKQPKFDKGSDIYPQLIALLDEGISDLGTTDNNPKPGGDDIVYGGNSANWIKAANTIKLKLYTQVRLVQDVSSEVTALLSNPSSLINSQSESFLFKFGPLGATDDRYPGYGQYAAAQRGGEIPSPWMYGIMKGYNPDLYPGIEDPRIPYYIYNQKSATAGTENCTDYRDGGFISIIFGSNGPCAAGANSNSYSLLGIYPVGGRYDDGAGKSINATATTGDYSAKNAGTGAAPQRALTYADRLYLEAELIHAGLAPGDEKTAFSKALDASFDQIDYVITNYIKPSQSVPLIAGLSTTETYKTNVLNAFDNGSADKKLEYIMTQKWLSRIGNSVDNYTDYRRTGYPVLFAPAPQGTVTSVEVPDGSVVPVANSTPYPLSLPWSTQEIELNSNAPKQKVPSSFKVFWQP